MRAGPPATWARTRPAGSTSRATSILHVPDNHQTSVIARERAGWLRCRLIEAADGPADLRRVADGDRHRGAHHRRHRADGATPRWCTARSWAARTARRLSGSPCSGDPVVASDAPLDPDRARRRGAGRPGPRCRTSPSPGRTTGTSGSTRTRARCSSGRRSARVGGGLLSHGAVPPAGAVLRLDAYRTGGGQAGNVARGQVRVLKTSIPYVSRVENRSPADRRRRGRDPGRRQGARAAAAPLARAGR